MSEHQPKHHEHGEHLPKTHEKKEHAPKHHEKEITTAEKNHGNKEQLDKLNEAVEQLAKENETPNVHERETPAGHHPAIVSKQIKDISFTRTMTRVRKRLSYPSKTLSKVIHTPVIDQTSEFIGKTVARPTSMLWGGIFAFVGTSALLWITRYYGYEYNYFVVIMLFIIGAIVGIAIEGVSTYFKSRKKV